MKIYKEQYDYADVDEDNDDWNDDEEEVGAAFAALLHDQIFV